MACSLFGAKPLFEQMLAYVNWTTGQIFQWNLNINTIIFFEENEFDYVCKLVTIFT